MPYNTTLTAYIDEGRKLFCSNTTGHAVLPPQTFTFGDRIGVTLHFNTGVIAKDDELLLVIDDDFYFYAADANLAAMSATTVTVTQDDVTNGHVSLTASTRYPKFRSATNGKERVIATMTLSRITHQMEGDDEDIVTVIPLAECKVFCKGLLQDYGDAPVELDAPVYYTKVEIDAIKKAMDDLLSDTTDAKEDAQEAALTAEIWAQGTDEEVEEMTGEEGVKSAKRHAEIAGGFNTAAGNSAALAESYTHGGTGKREGEATDNAKYYLEQLGNHEANAETYMNRARKWAEGTDEEVVEIGGTKSAKTFATNAGQSATNAHTSETNAEGYKALAESYAHGGTGKRVGESTDNAQYYNQQAGEKAVEALKWAEGTDEQVAALGGQHSSKKWAEMGEAAYNAIAYQLDGGSAASTYTENQIINGGNA